MKRFDVASMIVHGRDEKEKNVLCATPEFKIRVVALGPGEGMPECEMTSYVVFVCIEGEAEIRAGEDRVTLFVGQAAVSEPAILSMQSKTGARLLGIQIVKTGRKE